MATISAADVKKLRDATGAGMMDCKKALTEAEGDHELAVEILRVNGQAKAAKRGAEREASSGLVAHAPGVLVELKSEKAEDIEANVERIEQWITNWKKDHGKEGKAEAQSSGGKPEDDPMFLHG